MGHAKPVVPRPRRLRLESRPLQALAGTHDAYDTMTVDELTVTVQTDPGSFGRGQMIRRDPATGVLEGGTESRTDGHIAVW